MIKQIARHIIAILLAISIIILIFALLISSTILNETYVLKKLEEINYYSKIYEIVYSNFENYVYQSGLDETALEGIVSEEKVKSDTNSIISHIYNGLEEGIDNQSIKDKLNENINKVIGSTKVSDTQKKAIDTLVDTIANEYTLTILHFGVESGINNAYKNVVKVIDLAKKATLISITVCIILLAIITRRRIYRIFTFTAMSFISSGAFLIVVNRVITTRIKIQAITILNDTISEVLRNVTSEILGKIMFWGCGLVGVGIITVIVANSVHNAIKYQNKPGEN